MEIICVLDDNSFQNFQSFLISGVNVELELTVVLFMFCPAQMAYDLGLATAGVALS